MRLAIGKFSKNHNQTKIVSLAYRNGNGSIYSIKLPFGRFILITL